ncbi:MAG: DMT family transporter [Ardenticatenaceae bacterium]
MNHSLARSKGFIYLLLYSFILSSASIAAKIGLQQSVSPVELLGVRFVLAVALLWAYFLCFRRDAVRIDRAGLRGCMLVGFLNCCALYSYFLALSYLDASLVLVVHTTALIPAVMLLLMIRGQFPSRLNLIRFVIALIGIYLFVELVGELKWVGVVLAILAAFFFAVYMMIIQLRLADYNSLTITLYVNTFMMILFTIAYFANGYHWPQFDAVTWGVVLWLGIVATALGRIFFFAGIQLAGSQQAALLSPLDILLTVFWAVLLLGESLTLQQWVGTFFVMASVALAAKAKSDRVRPKATKAPEVQPNAT